MALQSPGVEVTVIDESFYTPAEPGTTPLIVVATAENKTNAAGTGTAAATTKANAGVAYRLTSQKDLVDLFGVPFFQQTAGGSPVHGGERNEYGLLAAYSFLGVSNNAFVVRADVDLDELEGVATEPSGRPDDGQWWVNTGATAWGIQEWNGAAATVAGGQKFSSKVPLVLTNDDSTRVSGTAPRDSVGSIGDYAVVFLTGTSANETAKIYYKSSGGTIANNSPVSAGQWVLVGSPEWCASHPTVSGSTAISSLTAGHSFSINGNTITVSGATIPARITNLVSDINNLSNQGISAKTVNDRLFIYSDGSTSDNSDSTLSGAIVIAAGSGTVLTDIGVTVGTYLQPKLTQAPHTQVPSYKRTDNTTTVQGYPTGSVWVKTTQPNNGSDWIISKYNSATQVWTAYSSPLYSSTHAALYYLDRSGLGSNIAVDSLFVQYNATENFSYAAPDDDTNQRDQELGDAQFRIWRRTTTGNTVIVSAEITTSNIVNSTNYAFTIKESTGALSLSTATTISFTGQATAAASGNAIAAAINAAGLLYVEAAYDADESKVSIYHKSSGDFRLTDVANAPIATLFGTGFNVVTNTGTANFYALTGGIVSGAAEDFLATNWKPLITEDFQASSSAPDSRAQDDQLWYNPAFGEVDIMVHNGNTWVGYRTATSPFFAAAAGDKTDPLGPIVAASEPTTQSDGSALKNGDLWISTADLENFPTIYKYDGLNLEWVLVDKTDQTTEEGVLFADARWRDESANPSTPDGTGSPDTISSLLDSNFLDFDAPDPDLYPRGMLLWNLRRSGGNVKRYQRNYITTTDRNVRFDAANSPAGNPVVNGQFMTNYSVDRWTTASANNEDGSGSFGRKAQRKVVVSAMKSVIDTSSQIRDEERRNFNIIAAPGYPECLSNLINLNIDRGLTAFVIGDTPLRLASDATTLVNWGTNANLVFDNGDDGIVSYDEYCAVYYPNGFTTDLGGNNAVVPASHMMLRTIALSDQVSYPWFAPAGTRRGGITNATSVGYIDSVTGEFQTVAVNEGTRDVLYDLKVNPIPFFVGSGLVAFGQKTRARNASALDRINVARLIVYLRSQLNKLARPYIFEPNDRITRDEVKGAVESLLLELVGLRAIYDFAVVCDETNNTPSRIDRNELWVDIAIEPVKAIEFIYIPLRVKNTGEI
jgi:hypothetical protein